MGTIHTSTSRCHQGINLNRRARRIYSNRVGCLPARLDSWLLVLAPAPQRLLNSLALALARLAHVRQTSGFRRLSPRILLSLAAFSTAQTNAPLPQKKQRIK